MDEKKKVHKKRDQKAEQKVEVKSKVFDAPKQKEVVTTEDLII